MKELEKLKKLISEGMSKKYLCSKLEISAPTLEKRLRDGEFKEYQIELINKLSEL